MIVLRTGGAGAMRKLLDGAVPLVQLAVAARNRKSGV
jgi:hypothetical protein